MGARRSKSEAVETITTPAGEEQPPSPSAPPPPHGTTLKTGLCTDERAQILAGYLCERVRMFKLASNLICLRKAPDGTITIESHG